MLAAARARTHHRAKGMAHSHLSGHTLAPAWGRAAAPGQPSAPRSPTAAQGQLRDHLEPHLKSSHVPASPLHFSSDGLSAVTFPTAIDRKHFITFPGGRIRGVGLISVSMVTSSGLVKDFAFLGCCWVVEMGGAEGAWCCIFCCCRFCFFCYYFFPFFLIPFSAHQGSRQPAKRDARSVPTAMPLAGRGPRAAFIPKMPLKPIEARTGAVFLLPSPPFPFPPLRASPARPGKSHSATQQGWPQAQVTARGVL